MKRKDLIWILAYPAYQIIGTFRHEGSHALAAMAEGLHSYFAITLLFYVWGIYHCYFRKKTWHPHWRAAFGGYITLTCRWPQCG